MNRTPIQIRFSDTDLVGHVNNVAYGYYFDTARMDYLEKVLNIQLDWRQGKVMVLVHIETDFFQSTSLYDIIEVTTRVVGIGNKSISMLQQLLDKDGQVKAESKSVLSTYDTVAKNSYPFPEEWKEKINIFEQQRL